MRFDRRFDCQSLDREIRIAEQEKRIAMLERTLATVVEFIELQSAMLGGAVYQLDDIYDTLLPDRDRPEPPPIQQGDCFSNFREAIKKPISGD